MKEIIDTISRTGIERQEYDNLLMKAISNIDEAIQHITYRSNLIDRDTGKIINKTLIDKLTDTMYLLEDYQHEDVYKPYKIEKEN